jgi:anti-sigma28 factor (negative regulator of flagellin synthesis)
MDDSTKRRFILEIRSAIDSCPVVREDKVKYLRLQIQQNLYRPDPDEIAQRMVKESLKDIFWQGRRSFQN